MTDKDTDFMKLAIKEAKKALLKNEVPVGAILVGDNGEIISKGYNCIESGFNSCAHAEIIAIRKASRKLKSWRLNGTTIYITLEPCLMCLGAIINSRIGKIVYGTQDPKGGSTNFVRLSSLGTKLKIDRINKDLELECSKLITTFFKKLRLDKAI